VHLLLTNSVFKYIFTLKIITILEKLLEDGSRFYLKGNFKRAIDCFLKVLENEPNNTKALFYLSIAYMDLNKYNEAIEVIDRLIKIEPDNALAYKNRALIKYSQNKEKEAMADYKVFVKLSQKE
ncbi:MAG: tetratricopeptide repeat protein, partial [Bacteroidales bacterium]|nr:tetratricopeptide repeat protein [Bacteroidales bacterium]